MRRHALTEEQWLRLQKVLPEQKTGPASTLGDRPVIHAKPERRKKHRLVRKLSRQRYLVEVFFHNLKRFRAIATRYEKTARNFLALLQIACAWLWLENCVGNADRNQLLTPD